MSKEHIEDRLVTPYVMYKHLPTQIDYVDFPFVYDNDYQKARFYSDERPMKLTEFRALQRPRHCACEMPVWTMEDMIHCAKCKKLLPDQP